MKRICMPGFFVGICTVCALFQVALTSPSSQQDIDNIAENLNIKISVQTNHVSSAKYQLVFQLTNKGPSKILDTDGWIIQFSLRNRNLLTKPEFEVHGLSVKEDKNSFYVIQKKVDAAKAFPGLNPGQAFQITVEANGISVFRYDIDPRFIVVAPNTAPKTIKSTDDEDLGFVNLAPINSSFDDFSKMTAVRRMVTQPDITDTGRVSDSVIIPSPKSVTPLTPNTPLLELGRSSMFYIWPDQAVSNDFKNYFLQRFLAVPGITRSKVQFVNAEPPTTADRIYMQIKPDASKTKDGYKLVFYPKALGIREYNLIHMSAPDETGLHNAMETFFGALGIYDIAPESTFDDDARYGIRSVDLDLTSHFFPLEILKKFLILMKRYKLNRLVLNLADDDGWRLQLPEAANFPELTTYGAKRCYSSNESTCVPPLNGAGTILNNADCGYFNTNEFGELLKFAKSINIYIVPKMNIMGSIRPAKKASHLRYNRLKESNQAEADRLHLISAEPEIAPEQIPEDVNFVDGLLDPCRKETLAFVTLILDSLNAIYKANNVPFEEFHAGGDAMTQFLGAFPSCKAAGISQADAMRNLITIMQGAMAKINGKLRVSEAAVIDPSTNVCLTKPSGSKYDPSAMIVDFRSIHAGNPEKWGLTPEQWAFLEAEVAQPSEDPNFVPDILRSFNGPKKGLAPWGKAYNCANNGYKVILSPEGFFSLDTPYELDFDEPANRQRRRFTVINHHRVMTFEPENYHINMDQGDDGYQTLAYRNCKVFICEPLKHPENILGLQASIDTRVIRNEKQLWHQVLPRLVLFAQKAWKKGEFENILKAEDTATLMNPEHLDKRAFFLNAEMVEFFNTLAYKELERLDAGGYLYRIPRPAASIQNGLPFSRYPPYPIAVKVDIPGMLIEYRDLNTPNGPWMPLFSRDEVSGLLVGGYNMTFPISSQKIELRAKSPDGKRGSVGVFLNGSTENYLPQDVPPELREGTCLPIEEPWTTEFSKITPTQFTKILSNIDAVAAEQGEFMMARERNLTAALTDYNRRYSTNATLPAVFQGIQVAMGQGQNVTMLPDNNVLKYIYVLDAQIYDNRGRFIEARFGRWQQEYLKCKAANAPANGSPQVPGAKVGSNSGTPSGSGAG